MQIDVGVGQVFGVNKNDSIFTRFGSSWTQLPGKLKHVTVGPAGVWGANRENHIFKLVGADWVTVPGKNNYTNNNIWNCGPPIGKVCM